MVNDTIPSIKTQGDVFGEDDVIIDNRFLCNNDKTEFLSVKVPINESAANDSRHQIVDCVVDPTDCAMNLGIKFDKHLSFRQYI
jgi:hypothetical protein